MAIELLHSAGLPTAFLTRENSPIVLARARKLGVHHVILGAVDKQSALSTLAQQLAVPLEAVAYIGDDLNDLPAIEIAGVSACPATRCRRCGVGWITSAAPREASERCGNLPSLSCAPKGISLSNLCGMVE
jgi:3-deoxy-D-manno-octulosonate 8-phosphate phosphatase (KDO 8-P phosphatase)